jgi:predicted nucleic acid-binding protein
MILDTAFLIGLLREKRDAFSKGVELAEQGIPQRIPAPVLFELNYGAEMYGSADEQRAIANLPRLYPVVRLSRELAFEAAELVAAADQEAGGEGQAGIDSIDPMVAAAANAVDEPVLTRNVEDFEALGVEVETF